MKASLTDHVGKKNSKNHENLLIYGVFRSQREKSNILKKIFIFNLIQFNFLKTLISLSKIFVKLIYEKSNTFQSLLNIHFRAFGDLQSCGSFGPLPPRVTKG